MLAASDTVDYDVLVIGSGAGGMAAAITARKAGLSVAILEKDVVFGGTTARSGGVLWVPNNVVSREAGAQDDIEAARTYMQHEAGALFDPERVEAFLTQGPEMVDFFTRETEVKFVALPQFSDYHPNAPGGRAGGRSIQAAPYDGRELGPAVATLQPPLREITFVGMMFNASQEVAHFFNVTRSLRSAIYVAKRLAKHAYELARYGRAMRLTNGNALAARLAKSAINLDIPIYLEHPAQQLISRDGRIAGVVVQTPKGRVEFHARRGVVLAAGGFPQDKERRRKLFRHDAHGKGHLSPAPLGNVGDGLAMAEAVGGSVTTDLPNAAAWIPVSKVPYRDGSVGVFPHLIDRYKPGIIAVTANGRRFVNEADSYHDFGKALLKAIPQGEVMAYLISDHRSIRRYGLGAAKPFPLPLLPYLRSGYLLRGRTVAELAQKAGIDALALEKTIAAFNGPATRGEDPEFGKGSTAYNRYLGDADHKPNACVAPLDTPPYYAVKVVMGDLGTFAGIRTDAKARVLDSDNRPIPGLYAAGNDMASIMGGNYPGGGITLGPAMTFGYIAGKTIAGQN